MDSCQSSMVLAEEMINGNGGMTNGDDRKRKKLILVLINPK